jgi:phosphoesterase RecJ-like protein
LNNFDYDHIRDLIGESSSIAVTSHHNPDGDAIGSILAMTALFRKLGKNASALVPNDYPEFLKWMPGSELVIIYNQSSQKAKETLARADLVFCLDYNAMGRTGAMEKAIRNAKGTKILIDHHQDPVLGDFDFFLSVTQTSSTSELVYRFLEGCAWLDLIDREISTGLFVGIMTDTGSFSYSCNSPSTFLVAASLIRSGIDTEHIHRQVYDTFSENRLRLLGYCLSEKLTILPGFSTAYIALSKSDLDRFHYQVGDTEDVVNFALSLKNIKLAILMTERKDRIRLSFRSKGDLAVNRIASEHFKGGGHRNAAGGDSFVSLEETINHLEKILVQYKDQIDRSSL